jgi:hypothetical protein
LRGRKTSFHVLSKALRMIKSDERVRYTIADLGECVICDT